MRKERLHALASRCCLCARYSSCSRRAFARRNTSLSRSFPVSTDGAFMSVNGVESGAADKGWSSRDGVLKDRDDEGSLCEI